MTAGFLYLVNSIGILALLGALYGVSLRLDVPEKPRRFLIGICFGFGAIAAMSHPVLTSDGLVIDPRGLIIGAAGAFLGPLGVSAAFCVAAAARLNLEGYGLVSDISGMAIAGLMGLYWAILMRRNSQVGIPGLLALGVFISWSLGAAALFPNASGATLLSTSGPYIVVFNVLGALVFGLFIERERRTITQVRNLNRAASTDPLTGLLNRRGLENRYQKLDAAQRHGGTAMLLIDLDHFKQINDRYGHDAGDMVLRGIAGVLARCVRGKDIAARLGGEEFAVLMPDTSHKAAARLSERIRSEIERLTFKVGSRQVRVTTSIGLHWNPDIEAGSIGLSQLLRTADQALYSAKENGRNRVEQIIPSLPAPLQAA